MSAECHRLHHYMGTLQRLQFTNGQSRKPKFRIHSLESENVCCCQMEMCAPWQRYRSVNGEQCMHICWHLRFIDTILYIFCSMMATHNIKRWNWCSLVSTSNSDERVCWAGIANNNNYFIATNCFRWPHLEDDPHSAKTLRVGTMKMRHKSAFMAMVHSEL